MLTFIRTIPYLYLPMNAFPRISLFAAKSLTSSYASYDNFFDIVFYNSRDHPYHSSLSIFFAGVFIDKLAIDEDRLETFTLDVFL